MEPRIVPDLFAVRPSSSSKSGEAPPADHELRETGLEYQTSLSVVPERSNDRQARPSHLWHEPACESLRLGPPSLRARSPRSLARLSYGRPTRYTRHCGSRIVRRTPRARIRRPPLPLPSGVSDRAVGRASAEPDSWVSAIVWRCLVFTVSDTRARSGAGHETKLCVAGRARS